ncbi:hypothetical protein N9J29_00340 [Candidatus Pelagibacter sp.]|nr:hypothetical protein [Candidatus Pelagibacter sp.]
MKTILKKNLWSITSFLENNEYNFDKENILTQLPEKFINEAIEAISNWDNYTPTPLLKLNKLNDELKLNNIYYKDGVKRKQVGVILDCKPLTGPNTAFWEITKEKEVVGKITSAVYSPRLKQNIALAMVSINNSEIGTVLDVKMNDKIIKATVAEKPFYDPKKKLASS